MYGHKYTEEEHAFMAAFVPGHSHREIAAAFTEKFGWEISIIQVKSYIANHHFHTGRTGHFQKGQAPPNKGKKMPAETYEKVAATMFRKGHIPKNHRPVGSERVNTYGYTEVKVAEPNKWQLKHRMVWEAANGKIPRGHIVIFRDNDKTNTDIDNLMLIKRETHATLNHLGLCEFTGEFKDTAVAIAELKNMTNQKRRSAKHAGESGSLNEMQGMREKTERSRKHTERIWAGVPRKDSADAAQGKGDTETQ